MRGFLALTAVICSALALFAAGISLWAEDNSNVQNMQRRFDNLQDAEREAGFRIPRPGQAAGWDLKEVLVITVNLDRYRYSLVDTWRARKAIEERAGPSRAVITFTNGPVTSGIQKSVSMIYSSSSGDPVWITMARGRRPLRDAGTYQENGSNSVVERLRLGAGKATIETFQSGPMELLSVRWRMKGFDFTAMTIPNGPALGAGRSPISRDQLLTFLSTLE